MARAILRSNLARPETLPLPRSEAASGSRLSSEEPSPINLTPVEEKEIATRSPNLLRPWLPTDTRNMLIFHAKARGLRVLTRWRKSEIIEALERYEASQNRP